MLPSISQAEEELRIAEELNPGPWTKHSVNVGIAARNIAEKIPSMNPEKAYIVGLLHDIGRRVGIVSTSRHVYEGYMYAASKGWDEVAKVCMTHSYPLMAKEFEFEPETTEDTVIKEYILGCECDDYDLLIQLCDSVAADYGFCILEKRFVDVARRYGIWENVRVQKTKRPAKQTFGFRRDNEQIVCIADSMHEVHICEYTTLRWNATFEIKEYFEAKMRCSIYDVLPDIGRTTLLCPPPWKPPVK